jgi:cellulose 1,4-beta-cellobiosidase
MKAAVALTFAASVVAFPFLNVEVTKNNDTVSQAGNPFAGAQLYANSFYAKEVEEAVKRISDPILAEKAKKAASIPSFFWL